MLHNIVFQDNIYQLARSIDTLYEGFMLELSEDIFLDKALDDILFFDSAIQKIVYLMRENSRLADYIDILHSLHSCEERFIRLLDSLLQGNSTMKEGLTQFMAKIQGIRNAHSALRNELSQGIHKGDSSSDARDIVSRNELSELLNF